MGRCGKFIVLGQLSELTLTPKNQDPLTGQGMNTDYLFHVYYSFPYTVHFSLKCEMNLFVSLAIKSRHEDRLRSETPEGPLAGPWLRPGQHWLWIMAPKSQSPKVPKSQSPSKYVGLTDSRRKMHGNTIQHIRPLENQLCSVPPPPSVRPPNSPALIWAYREGIAPWCL
jgi:hypothetical protein